MKDGNQLRSQEELSSPKPNAWEGFKTMKELREDSPIIIITADKGVAMVVMDRQDYINKAQQSLEDRVTNRPITMNPTSRLKHKLILTLRNIKSTGGLNDFQYKRLYPTSAALPKFYGLSKIYKVGTLLRPTVSSREQSHMVLPRSWSTPSNPWCTSPLTTLKTTHFVDTQ